MTALASCSVCATPYAPVSDDPSPAHPGCAPSDRERYEAATRGPRTYKGVMAAIHASRCVCGAAISVGDVQTLRGTDDGVRWVCASCATAPQGALSAPESAPTALPCVPGTPAGRSERSGEDDTTALRRAV